MRKFEIKIHDKVFVANAEKDLYLQIDTLFAILNTIDKNKLINGFSFQVGWTIYFLKEKNENYFEILAPDFIKNPFENKTKDLTLALWVQLEQVHLLRQLDINGESTKFSDKIILTKDVLDQERIYLQRQADVKEGDSGWFIGNIEESETDDFYAIYSYQLLKLRPELIKVLSLPEEYMVIFKGKDIDAILNNENKELNFNLD